jgi:hypothetical protein
VDVRRLVAGICTARLTIVRMPLEKSGIPSGGSAARTNAAPSHFYIPVVLSHPTCQFREAGAACSHG